MKNIASLILALVANSALASNADNVVKNVQAVCQYPDQAGKYWNVTATGKAGIKGNIRLASVGVNGEATFTQAEWEGVQRVLKEHQSSDNASYRDCAVKLTPLFLEKFSVTIPKMKPVTYQKSTVKPNPEQSRTSPVKSSPSSPPRPDTQKAERTSDIVKQETYGEKSPAINSKGDVNIHY